MQFHDAYTVKPGDNLWKIGKSKGYSNPGPIVAYPPNRQFFQIHSPDHLKPGDSFFIPWQPELLRKFIATMEDLVVSVQETAKELIEGEEQNREELEQFLVKIDSINLIAQIHVSIGALAVENAAAMAGKEGAMESGELLEWLADNRVHMIAGDLVPMIVPQPNAPKQDYKFYIRHALGPWTPSYWASVYTAIKTGDLDLYLYGTDAIVYRNAKTIADNAKLEIIKIQAPLNHAKQQLALPIYLYRVGSNATVLP
jgi:hypothetical protein